MAHSRTNTLGETAQAAVRVDHLERDREAWNLPRAPADTVPPVAPRDELDWDGFRDTYYPDSPRHDFKSIAAYGAYKRSPYPGPQPMSEAANPKGAPIAAEVVLLSEWENEGGALPEPVSRRSGDAAAGRRNTARRNRS